MRILSMIILLVMATTIPATAEIYKWKDKNGVTHFSNTSPAIKTKYQAIKVVGDTPEKKTTLTSTKVWGQIVDDNVTIKFTDGAAFWYPKAGILRIFLCPKPIPDEFFKDQLESMVAPKIEVDALRNGKGLSRIDLHFNKTNQPVKSKIKKGAHRIEILNPHFKSSSTIYDSDNQGVTKSMISLSFPVKQEKKWVALHFRGSETKIRINSNNEKLLISWNLKVNLPIYNTSSNIRIEKRL